MPNNYGHEIRMLTSITQKEYEQIQALDKVCCTQDGVNLKLELDYKLHLSKLADKKEENDKKIMNEFLYYKEGELVSYLGISCFDGVTGEINGMTHPEWRERGFFHRLLELATAESRRAGYTKLLLVADGNSKTGMQFLESVGDGFEHSEYRMKRRSGENKLPVSNQPIVLRPASKADEIEIARQNSIYFQDEFVEDETGNIIVTPIEECPENTKIYMIELQGSIIGKINVEYSKYDAFILGFGIRPEYRRKGYGRIALTETIRMIETQDIQEAELDVVCTNSNALNLYKSCGFAEESVMNYHNFKL